MIEDVIIIFRYYIGFYFLVTGLLKMLSYSFFINHLLSLKIISNNNVVRITGYLIPIIEVFCGIMILIHAYIKLMLFLMLSMTLIFTFLLIIIYKKKEKGILTVDAMVHFFMMILVLLR